MYTQFYSFSEEPFKDTPDPRFLFLTESHKKALDSMVYGINNKKGLILISGEVGTGKTILIHQLLNGLDKMIKTVFIYHPKITFEDLLKTILLELNIPLAGQNKTSLIHQFNDYLTQRFAHNENIVIFIDEAQSLRKDVLEELSALANLEISDSNLLQIVFVGQPEFEFKLNSQELNQLSQRIKIRCQIRPLTKKEARDYIDHRLNLVGSCSAKVFTPEAVSLICRRAAGIPRTLNLICDSALRIGCQFSEKKIDVPIVKKALDEMFIQELKIPWFPAFGEKFLSRRISYSVLAIICLALVIFLGREYIKSTPEKMALKGPIKQPIVTGKVVPPSPEIKGDFSPKNAPIPAFDKEPTTPKPPQPVSLPPSPLPQPKIESRSYKTIKVAERDTLSSLCLKYYNVSNSTVIDHILEFNPQIISPNLIMAHQKIKIPEITESSLIIESSDGKFKVYLGTFAKPEYARPFKDESVLQGKTIEFIPKKVSPEMTWYRVVAGNFDTREEGLEVILDLKKKGILPSFGVSFKR